MSQSSWGTRPNGLKSAGKDFEATYGVNVELVYNDKAEEWNNAYSLWCGRDLLSQDVVLANGDTVHPVSVEELLEARPDNILLAMDDVKVLGEEPMKMQLDASGGLTRITKLMDPAQAAGNTSASVGCLRPLDRT